MKFALVFPGQGSQSVGMLDSFAGSRVVRDTFAEASDILHQDLWQLAAAGQRRRYKSDRQHAAADAHCGIRRVSRVA